MHIDARKLENGSLIEGDICIVGAGAAGISMAMDWMHTPYRVVLLEAGGFQIEPEIQDLFNGKTTGQRYYSLDASRLHYFGGTTGHWAGYCSPYDPIDFKKRSWVPMSGWPISREDLDPFFHKAHEIVELGPYNYDLNYWQKQDPDLVPLPFDSSSVFNKLWQFSPPTRFGKKYKDTIVNAKNVFLYTYATVTDIKASDNLNAVKELVVKTLSGKQHTVRAKRFVLAGCALQNARLLLASNSQAQGGLGNSHDLVGRHFMEHLEIKSADLLFPSPVPLKLYRMEFYKTKVRAELAISEAMQEKAAILNGTVSLEPKALVKDEKAMIDRWPDNAKATVQMWDEDEKRFKESPKVNEAIKGYKEFELFTRLEQAPNSSSRVTLDSVKDALGVPRLMLNWQLSPLEKHSLRKIYEIIGREAGKAGIGRVRMMDYLHDAHDYSWPSFTGAGWHHMGTTRMSENPKDGVVDRECKVHGLDNLYIAGSSCFPTAGAANPTLTLLALTLRLSAHLKSSLKK